MQVILLEKVRNLGNLGQKVSVKSGYGRNYLIPQGKAVPATADNLDAFEARRAELEAKAAAILNEAESRAAKLKEVVLTLKAMASEEGKLYGSIGTQEIEEALESKGFEVAKREILMPTGAIHSVGEYEIDLQLHTDVTCQIKLHIEAA